MSPQLRSNNAPLPPPDVFTDGTPLYSSFEHFEPGLEFLSNDPSSEDRRHVLWQQQRLQNQQRDLRQSNAPQEGTIHFSHPHSNDSDVTDLLYIVDNSGKTTVMDLTSPEPASAPLAPPALTPSAIPILYALPAEHDDASQTAYLPPLSAAFNSPSKTTTIIAGSGSARALLGPELAEEECNELDYEARLMSWWPRPEADELKVERM